MDSEAGRDDADRTAVWVVCFLDLMGYRSDLEALGDPPAANEDEIHQRFANVVERRRILVDGLQLYSGAVNVEVTGFSDSVFVQSAFGDYPEQPLTALNNVVLAAIGALFVNLLSGSALRGGIDIGFGLRDHGHVYTAATARAVSLEKCARYPRILVGPNLLATLDGLSQHDSADGEMARKIRSVFYRDLDDQQIALDFMGLASRRTYARGFTEKDVREIWSFAKKSRDEFGARGESKIAGYYERLIRYLEPRLNLWGLGKTP